MGAHFLFSFFTYSCLEMMASAPQPSAAQPQPSAAQPQPSAPQPSAPQPSAAQPSAPQASGPRSLSDEKRDKIISKLRDLFCKFKTPYLEERDGDDENSSIQNVKEVEESARQIDNLFMTVTGFIDAMGAPPTGADENTLSIYKVFEPLMKELRENPSLQEDMRHYAKLDLRTYPFTISVKHIKHLERDGIQSLTRIVPNTVVINTSNQQNIQ